MVPRAPVVHHNSNFCIWRVRIYNLRYLAIFHCHRLFGLFALRIYIFTAIFKLKWPFLGWKVYFKVIFGYFYAVFATFFWTFELFGVQIFSFNFWCLKCHSPTLPPRSQISLYFRGRLAGLARYRLWGANRVDTQRGRPRLLSPRRNRLRILEFCHGPLEIACFRATWDFFFFLNNFDFGGFFLFLGKIRQNSARIGNFGLKLGVKRTFWRFSQRFFQNQSTPRTAFFRFLHWKSRTLTFRLHFAFDKISNSVIDQSHEIFGTLPFGQERLLFQQKSRALWLLILISFFRHLQFLLWCQFFLSLKGRFCLLAGFWTFLDGGGFSFWQDFNTQGF